MDRKVHGVMVNEDHSPSDEEEEILEIMKDGRDRPGEPWGYATPGFLKEQGVDSVDFHLRQLRTAGWIKQVSRGFYKLVEDPREDDNGD